MGTYLLVDGNSLTYRAFFALPSDMATASGQVTNAVFGFTSMLILVLKEQRPDGVLVAFDRPEPTFRHEAEAEYKANREAAPDILRQQMGLVRQVVETLRIPIIEAPGYEADDIIATLATEARDQDDEVLIVTGDREMVAQVYLKKGALVPMHSHDSEQMTYILQGAMKFLVGGEEITLREGEVLHIPSWVEHQAEALDDTFELDVFSPIRQDWLDHTDTYFHK